MRTWTLVELERAMRQAWNADTCDPVVLACLDLPAVGSAAMIDPEGARA